MNKVEGAGESWHGHVTALTVAPEYRRMGLAQIFMDYLETVSDRSVIRILSAFCKRFFRFLDCFLLFLFRFVTCTGINAIL